MVESLRQRHPKYIEGPPAAKRSQGGVAIFSGNAASLVRRVPSMSPEVIAMNVVQLSERTRFAQSR